MDISAKVDGLKDILREIEKLGEKEARRMSNNALRAGARVVRDQVKANAAALDDPATASHIAKNVVVRSMSKRKMQALEADAGVRVGILGGARKDDSDSGSNPNKGGETFHWRFLEFGTQNMPPKPFFRPAVVQSEAKAISAFFEQMKKEFDKI